MRERVALLRRRRSTPGRGRAAATASTPVSRWSPRRERPGRCIADDQALVRGGFRMILDAKDDIEVVGEAEDGSEAVGARRRAEARRRADGRPHAGHRRHRGHAPDRRRRAARRAIIILTTFDLDEYVFAALRAGASGFLLKDVRPAELVEAIRVVAARRRPARRRASPAGCSTASPPRCPPTTTAAPTSRADRARARGAAPRGARAVERRDRRAAVPDRGHRQDARVVGAAQARPARPGAGGRLRLRRRPPHPEYEVHTRAR